MGRTNWEKIVEMLDIPTSINIFFVVAIAFFGLSIYFNKYHHPRIEGVSIMFFVSGLLLSILQVIRLIGYLLY